MKKIAITGGVASGKSTVCRVFHELGAYTVNADAIVHELLATDADLVQQIVRLLGPEVLDKGKLSRPAIADKVFTDSELLHALEKLLHPAVLHKIEELYRKASREGGYGAFVVEVPLLYEAGQDSFYDLVLVVLSDEALCRARYRRAGHTDPKWQQRMKRQWHPDEKAKQANYILHNNGTLEELREQIKRLYKQLHN